MCRCATIRITTRLANRIASKSSRAFLTEKAIPKNEKNKTRTSQRFEQILGLRFESCDLNRREPMAIWIASNCERRFETSKIKEHAKRPIIPQEHFRGILLAIFSRRFKVPAPSLPRAQRAQGLNILEGWKFRAHQSWIGKFSIEPFSTHQEEAQLK